MIAPLFAHARNIVARIGARSLIAGGIALVLCFVSMGGLGAALYSAVHPLLGHAFGDIGDWFGDWVRPAMILAGMLWAAAFPVAGWINVRLARPGRIPAIRRAAYVAVLWLPAAAIWAVLRALPGDGIAAR